ncbi:PepSY domain-containing protein [Neptunitalea lumnitzerae]|uniref:NADPH--hemoprotein reductase n=1 Tax=Neptunitalea lumnitzerae TaxID=2965509 RepID=A0ABQ5MJ10_9FLAO|nr:PepSY domain-containing protein [Neptunitalea sp. Y10]GLB49312.1 hypothetical protein Y10_16800 [Neptunitalea sp. Y10]
MTLSIWRYSHLALAVCSFLFLIIASLTGIVLAFQPINNEFQLSSNTNLNEIPVAKTIDALQQNYLEILEVKITPSHLVTASVITDEGDLEEFYIDPITTEKICDIIPETATYKFAKTLHRSLFLHTTGRIFMMLTSFILVIITISGFVLIIKRQQGIRHFFDRIINDHFFQYSHVYLGRVLLIPILIISISGVLLSVYQLNIVTHTVLEHSIDEDNLSEEPTLLVEEFPGIHDVYLSDIKSIEFPFSPDVTDFYKFYLEDRELVINQYTGEVESSIRYPFSEIAYQWGYILHTGESSYWWATILLLAAIAILFFVVSGFKITFKRREAKLKNKYKRVEATHVILVGSEGGTTLKFAVWLQEQLTNNQKKVYIDHLNNYTHYPKLQQLLILTASYGVGEAPSNASKFISKFSNVSNTNFQFTVLGFGSLAYKDYCKFAYEVQAVLKKSPNCTPVLPLHTVNNQSAESFNQWVLQYAEVSGVALGNYKRNEDAFKHSREKEFVVQVKTELETSSNAFMLFLKPTDKSKFKSGDLVGISPAQEEHQRLYSVGVLPNQELVLSIKLHEYGKCSNFLNNLSAGETIKASRIKNKSFYFPKRANHVVLIATGTGIAPFLGMVKQNTSKIATHLFWGAKNSISYNLYADIVSEALQNKQLEDFIPAYSREFTEKQYVQDKLKEKSEWLAGVLDSGGVIMICGSVLMQKDVLELLQSICLEYNGKPLSYYQKKKQLLMDCY